MKRSPYKDATRIRAKYFPRDRAAVIYGKKRITWRELNQRINRLGNALRDLGIKKGDKCAFLFHNTPEFIETNLAIQGLGAVPVPLNYRYVERELEYVLDNSDSICFIFEMDALKMVQDLKGRLTKVKHFICKGDNLPEGIISYEELVGSHPDRDLKAEIELDDVAVIIYTGGTTGFPKGVMLTYRNLQANQEALTGYLSYLLPPVEEMESELYAKNEFQRRVLNTVSDTMGAVKPLFSEPDLADKVVVLETETSSGISIPPVTITTREGKMKPFTGKPPKYDLLINVKLGDDFREFRELSIYPYTL
ncbi:MAG: AMP-binding protein, partial [Deltaproteobacteria bacterium]